MDPRELTTEDVAAGWKHGKLRTKGRKPQFGDKPAPNFTKNGSKHHCPYCSASLTFKKNGIYQQVISCAKDGHIRPCPEHQAPCFIAWPAGDKCPATKERERAELAVTEQQQSERDREQMKKMLQNAESRDDQLSVWRYRAALDDRYSFFCLKPLKYLNEYFGKYMVSRKVAQAEASKAWVLLKDLLKKEASRVETTLKLSEDDCKTTEGTVITLAERSTAEVNAGTPWKHRSMTHAIEQSAGDDKGPEATVPGFEQFPSHPHIVKEIDVNMPERLPVTTTNTFSPLSNVTRAGTIVIKHVEHLAPATVVARKPPPAKLGEWTEVSSHGKRSAKKRQTTVAGLKDQSRQSGKGGAHARSSVTQRDPKTASTGSSSKSKLSVFKRKQH